MSRRRALSTALVGVVATLAVGCGRDDFENEPRPPKTLEATVEIEDAKIDIDPPGFGAGLVNFAIVNTSAGEVVFALTGPAEGQTNPIPPAGSTVFKIQMPKGVYTASVPGNKRIRPTEIEVGPERKSAQDELLLP